MITMHKNKNAQNTFRKLLQCQNVHIEVLQAKKLCQNMILRR